jgi:hypothetical protein
MYFSTVIANTSSEIVLVGFMLCGLQCMKPSLLNSHHRLWEEQVSKAHCCENFMKQAIWSIYVEPGSRKVLSVVFVTSSVPVFISVIISDTIQTMRTRQWLMQTLMQTSSKCSVHPSDCAPPCGARGAKRTDLNTTSIQPSFQWVSWSLAQNWTFVRYIPFVALVIYCSFKNKNRGTAMKWSFYF